MQIEVVINYTQNDGPSSVQKTFPLVVHGRNAIVWSDKRRLASSVSPNEEKLIELNKSINQDIYLTDILISKDFLH